jgi:hypothetical protein
MHIGLINYGGNEAKASGVWRKIYKIFSTIMMQEIHIAEF